MMEIIEEIDDRREEMCKVQRLFREGKFPKRITHCDTKVNNILFDKDGKIKASDTLIATGDKLKIYDRNGYCMLTYDVVIYGDVSGDGKIDVFDFAYVRKLIIKNTGLSGIYLEAANVNKQSETVDIFDFATIRRFIIKGVAIEQK
jgi:hypothetical protein